MYIDNKKIFEETMMTLAIYLNVLNLFPSPDLLGTNTLMNFMPQCLVRFQQEPFLGSWLSETKFHSEVILESWYLAADAPSPVINIYYTLSSSGKYVFEMGILAECCWFCHRTPVLFVSCIHRPECIPDKDESAAKYAKSQYYLLW